MNTRCKHLISLVLFLILSINLFAQLKFENIGFNEALQKAEETNQLIFVQLISDCDQCNVVASRGLSHEKVVQIFNKFVCIKLVPGDPDFDKICKDFMISPRYPTSLIVDYEGNFLAIMYDKSTSRYEEYINLAALAMSNSNHPPLAKYVRKYSSGEYDREFLREYIISLRKFRFETDDLLDEYLGLLYVDSLFTPEVIVFIVQSAPLVDSRPYKLARFNSALFDAAFMSLPLKERVTLNNLVVGKSLKKAYRDKDERYMLKVANFNRRRYDDAAKGSRAYFNTMLDFYSETKDTIKYIHNAKNYYRWNLEKLDIDSISIVENNDFIKTKDGRIIKSSGRLVVGNQVNKMAWSIYELSNDPENLGMILKWTERILVYENPAYHDTYAHILYKLGAKDKAIIWQKKAIELSNAVHRPTGSLEEELEKMRTDSF